MRIFWTGAENSPSMTVVADEVAAAPGFDAFQFLIDAGNSPAVIIQIDGTPPWPITGHRSSSHRWNGLDVMDDQTITTPSEFEAAYLLKREAVAQSGNPNAPADRAVMAGLPHLLNPAQANAMMDDWRASPDAPPGSNFTPQPGRKPTPIPPRRPR